MRVFSALVMGLSMLSVILAAAIPAGLDGAIASTTLAVSSLAASSVSSAPSAGHAAADKVAAQVHPSIFEIPATAPVAAASATVTNVVTSSSSLSLAASPTETVHHAGPYLPYQCSTAWSLEESLPNPAECSYCYANRTEECYEALNCEWSYRLDALICPVGLPAASSSSSAPASATPVPVQYATPLERCWVQYEFVLDEFDIWGVNWDQKKLDGKGTPGWGKGLYHQLHGCGALSHWRFEPVRPSPGRPWTFHAWGRTTIMKGRCIQRAMKSAGAPRGHCSGST